MPERQQLEANAPPRVAQPESIARFWSKVEVRRSTQCWTWKAACNEHGYGVFKLPSPAGTAKAHRLAWEMFNNRSLLPDEALLHKCDNPPCVNPAHLSIGTQSENHADMVNKGRQRGIKHSRLTPEEIDEIRTLCEQGVTQADVARRFCIAQSYVSLIKSRHRLTR